MPLQFRIDLEADLVITEVDGAVSAQDLVEHTRRLVAVPNRPLRELADFSDQVRVSVSPAVVRNTAWRLSDAEPGKPGSKLALVGRSDSIYAMLRLFRAHREEKGLRVQVFRDRATALEWLDASDLDETPQSGE